jgi:hypothetical protein
VYAGQLPTPGLYTTVTPNNETHLLQQPRKVEFDNFRVEKRWRTPYGTRSYLSGGAAQ